MRHMKDLANRDSTEREQRKTRDNRMTQEVTKDDKERL